MAHPMQNFRKVVAGASSVTHQSPAVNEKVLVRTGRIRGSLPAGHRSSDNTKMKLPEELNVKTLPIDLSEDFLTRCWRTAGDALC